MKHTAAIPAQYLQIACDLAARIARGELPEGSRIYGRSVMASEYNVSPETIRRALKLLSDMKVVEIKPQSGAVVLSRDSARRYIESFGENSEYRALRDRLRGLMDRYAEMNRELLDVVSSMVQTRASFLAAEAPLPNYEVAVPEGSKLIGASIGELKFWQRTGATVIAIRRGSTVILSPGPYAEFFAGDVLLLVGTPAAAEAAHRVITERE